MPSVLRQRYGTVNIDLLVHVLSTSLLHPFVSWMIPLSFRAVALEYNDPRIVISSIWAALMTFRFILSVFNHRTAFGVPRDIDWEEEVVVVTGGANGIGLCIAETYGLRGASVAVLDTAELEHADDRGISMYKCDVSNRADVKRVAKLIQQELGPPTILINNAGIVHGKPLLELTEEEVKQSLNVNLLGHFNTLHTFLPGMLESPVGGTIVTMASVLGPLGAANLSDYSASKAGVIAMHNSLLAELRHSKEEGAPFIKTLLVTPGQIGTQLFRGLRTPSSFFAPIVEPVEITKAIVKLIDGGEGGELAMPLYARWTWLYGVLPAGVQKVLRSISGIDTAMAASFGKELESKGGEIDEESKSK